MFRFLSVLFLLVLGVSAKTQVFTLQGAIDTALANNIPVKQSQLLSQSANVNLNQSKLNLLPYVSGDILHGIYNGRSIDPFTNGYVNQTLNSATYQVNSGIVLFNGGSLQNTIRQNAAAYEASKMEWQQSKDNLVLNVILAYLQVLNNEDLLVAATNQAAVSQKQLERLEILHNQGAFTWANWSRAF